MRWFNELLSRTGWIGALTLGAAIGVAIWAMSPLVAGTPEPWDSENAYYFGSLFLSGILLWLLFRSNAYIAIIGLYVGQLGYLLVVGFGPLVLLGSVLLAAYSLIAGAGVVIAYAIMGRNVQRTEDK